MIQKTAYDRAEEKFITRPLKKLGNISLDELSYDQSRKLISELTSILEKEDRFNALDGNLPKLKRSFEGVKSKMSNTIEQLQEFRQASRPLSSIELYSITNSNQPISLMFIRNKCERVETLGGTGFDDNQLFYLFDEDVIHYYRSELNLVTDAQRESYKASEDYPRREAEIKVKKEEMFNTIYYVEHSNPFKNKQIIFDDNRIKIQVSTNSGNSVSEAKPPKAIKRIDLSQLPIETEDKPDSEITDYLPLNLDPTSIKEVKTNLNDLALVFLFKIADKQITEYDFVVRDQKAWHIKDPVFSPSFLRVMLANTESGDLYYDELHRF